MGKMSASSDPTLKVADLSHEYADLQRLRAEVRNATRVKHAVETILKAERDERSTARRRLTKYLSLLVSTGTTDGQLLMFGTAYLNEIREPDSRYSGC